jgi:hypothetical protein
MRNRRLDQITFENMRDVEGIAFPNKQDSLILSYMSGSVAPGSRLILYNTQVTVSDVEPLTDALQIKLELDFTLSTFLIRELFALIVIPESERNSRSYFHNITDYLSVAESSKS